MHWCLRLRLSEQFYFKMSFKGDFVMWSWKMAKISLWDEVTGGSSPILRVPSSTYTQAKCILQLNKIIISNIVVALHLFSVCFRSHLKL